MTATASPEATQPGPHPVPSEAVRSWAAGVAVMAVYSACAVVGYWHSWVHPATVSLGGGLGDAGQTMWYLRWVPWALGHGHSPLFSTLANWPFGVNLVDQTSVMALGLIVSPVTLLFGPVVAFNLCLTAAFALSAGAAYLLCRRIVAWRPAAFAGGLLYGFSPYMVGQGTGHLNLVFVPLPPLIFLVLHDLLLRGARPRRSGLLLGVLVIVQFLISSEILATTALFALAATVVLAVGWRDGVHSRLAPLGAALGWAAALALVALAWPLDVLLAGTQHITGSIVGFRYYFSSLLSPVLPTSNMRFGTTYLDRLGDRNGGNLSENGGYLGVPLLVVGALSVLLVREGRRAAAVRVSAVLAVIAFVASLGDRLHIGLLRYASVGSHVILPAAVLYKIPLVNQAFPERYSLYVALFVGLVLAGGLEALRDWVGARRPAGPLPAVVAAVVGIVALLPLVPAWPYRDQARTNVPPYFTTSASSAVPAGSVALVYPYPSPEDAQGQLWQAEAGLRFAMPGGYYLLPKAGGGSETAAPTLTAATLAAVLNGPAPARTPALRARLRRELGTWGVQSLLVQPVGHDPVGFFMWLAGRGPDATRGGMVEWYRLSWTAR